MKRCCDMATARTKSGRVIKVVYREEEKNILTQAEREVVVHAVEAVIATINKVKICKKPIAGYNKKESCLCRI